MASGSRAPWAVLVKQSFGKQERNGNCQNDSADALEKADHFLATVLETGNFGWLVCIAEWERREPLHKYEAPGTNFSLGIYIIHLS